MFVLAGDIYWMLMVNAKECRSRKVSECFISTYKLLVIPDPARLQQQTVCVVLSRGAFYYLIIQFVRRMQKLNILC